MLVQKQQLQTFYEVLKGTEGVLNFADARVRDAFLKKIVEAIEMYTEEKNKIYSAFAHKKEDGTPDISDGQFHFDVPDVELVNAELLVLAKEEVELSGVNKIKSFIEQSEYKPKAGEMDIIDELLNKL